MTQIIIVGHPQSGLASVEHLLLTAGMAAAQPSRRERLPAQAINATLIKAHGATPIEQLQNAEPLQQIEVAPVWQGMVLDLMLGNLDHPLWGWADPQAVYLLDYWKNLDPKVVFALTFDAPYTALTRLSLDEAAAPEEELQRRLDAWVAVNSALLSFHLGNPSRSVLVHSQHVQTLATRTLQHLSERIAAPLELTTLEPTAQAAAGELAGAVTTGTEANRADTLLDDAQVAVLARLLMEANPHAQTLYAELQAASTLATNAPQHALLALADADNADNVQLRYRAWQAAVGQQQRIHQLNQRVVEAASHSARLQERIEHTEQRLESARHDAQFQLQTRDQRLQEREQQLRERDQQLTAAQQQAQHAAQENDLLLDQLQHVQQELERQHLGHASAKTELQTKTQHLSEQLSATQAKLKQQEEVAQQAKTELQNKTKQLTAQLTETQAKLKQHEQTAEQTQKKTQHQLTELQQESELLLEQLHKVQQELERYYVENQKLKANQKPKAPHGAAERIKNELAYRLGACLIQQTQSVKGWLTFPFALRAEAKRYRQSVPADQKLPPIETYSDAAEAERVKQHLSYRLGACLVANTQTLGGWLTLPFALLAEHKAFQQARTAKA